MMWILQKIAAAAALSISTDCFTYSVQLQALKKGDPSHQQGAFIMGFIT